MTTRTSQTAPIGLLWLPFVVLIVVYLPTLVDLVFNWWQDDNYSHGFLVPLVSAWLIWSVRRELAALPRSTNPYGLALVILGMALFVLGAAAAEYFTARLSLVLTLFGLVWYLFGNEIVRKTWFAFFFLCFMIPVPYVFYYTVAFPMQVAATRITVDVLQFIGMAIVRQGNIIHLDSGFSLEVADACSGIRSLVALLALGAIYAYWSQKKWLPRLLVFLSTVPIAVFANVVRVLITTILASVGLTEITEEPWHSGMGLLVFVIAFIGLFVVAALLRRIFR
jgi:exosortase